MESNKPTILLFTDWYYPGYRAGGPIQSCRNLVRELSSEFLFCVFTSDADFGEKTPYKGILSDRWTTTESGEKVYYSARRRVSYRRIQKLITENDPAIIYLNSMFSYRFTVLPLIVLRLLRYRGKIVLAPRGMLQAGALSFKIWKKKIFFTVFKGLNFHKEITFHATDRQELEDIFTVFPKAQAIVAENVPSRDIIFLPSVKKYPGSLQLLFFSRLHPKKNLHYLLERLADLEWSGKIALDVYGSTESEEYLARCRQLASKVSESVTVRFLGSIQHKDMLEQMPVYHALVLPTLGENFGHVIFESLMSGVPVLISDQTPWKGLITQHAGWDISLAKEDEFSRVIATLLAMDQSMHQVWREGARKKAEEFLKDADFIHKYRMLFQ